MHVRSTEIHWLVRSAFLIALACSTDPAAGPPSDLPDTVADSDDASDSVDHDASGQPETDLFAQDRVLSVELTLPASDWDVLRQQARDPLQMRGADCLDHPWKSPFTWFKASVVVDGVRYDDVGMKKKGGLTAMDTQRPPMRLDFDKYVAGREVAGQDDLVLNRAIQDPSLVRTCLAYRLFNTAGVPAPRCAFATVTVNGEALGLYVHVERVDRDFLEEHFDDPSGDLWEGSTSDVRARWNGTFELDTNEDTATRTRLEALVTAAEAPDAEVVGAVSALLDLDAFLTFWAMETLLESQDGYTANMNNFYLYDDPKAGRFRFLPWGADAVFPSFVEPTGHIVPAVMTSGLLARRLYSDATVRASYQGRVRSLAATLFSTEATTALLAEVDRLESLLGPFVAESAEPTFTAELEFVRAALRDRAAAVERGLAEAPTEVVEPLRESPCQAVLGTIAATFDTTWGTFELSDPYASGTATLTGSVPVVADSFTRLGATAGAPFPDAPFAVIHLVGERADGTQLAIDLQLPRADLHANASVAIDLAQVSANLNDVDVSGAYAPIGLVGPGTIGLELGGTSADDAIRGTLTGDVLHAF